MLSVQRIDQEDAVQQTEHVHGARYRPSQGKRGEERRETRGGKRDKGEERKRDEMGGEERRGEGRRGEERRREEKRSGIKSERID
jgi:hypothetical protein